MRERVIEAIRGRTSISLHDLGDLAGALRSEVEAAGWRLDDRAMAGAWSFDFPRRPEARAPEATPPDQPIRPSDHAGGVPAEIWRALAYSSAEHGEGTLRISYAYGKCYQHEMLSGVWTRCWLDEGAVALLHQVILGRYRAAAWPSRPCSRRMGEVSLDNQQITLDGRRFSRSGCGIRQDDPWYSVEVCVGVDGFSVIESWRRGPCHPGDKTSYRLEASEVPIDVRCVALAVMAMG